MWFESKLGSQNAILELIAISLASLEGLEQFTWRLCFFSSTPVWTRTANEFIRSTSIPQTNRYGSAISVNFRVAEFGNYRSQPCFITQRGATSTLFFLAFLKSLSMRPGACARV